MSTHLHSHPNAQHQRMRTPAHQSLPTEETSHRISQSPLPGQHTETRQSPTLRETYKLHVMLLSLASRISHSLEPVLRPRPATSQERHRFARSQTRQPFHTLVTDSSQTAQPAQELRQLVLESSTRPRRSAQRAALPRPHPSSPPVPMRSMSEETAQLMTLLLLLTASTLPMRSHRPHTLAHHRTALHIKTLWHLPAVSLSIPASWNSSLLHRSPPSQSTFVLNTTALSGHPMPLQLNSDVA